MASVSGLPAFLLYGAAASGLLALYLKVYLTATAHHEIALIRQNNGAAAIALGGSLIGYALPLSVAIHNAETILDCIIWGLIGLIVQLAIYAIVRFALPNLSHRIEAGETAGAILLASSSLAGGIIDAAAMTY